MIVSDVTPIFFLNSGDDGCPIIGHECDKDSMRSSHGICLKFRFRHDLRRLPGYYDPGEFTFMRQTAVDEIKAQVRGAFFERGLCIKHVDESVAINHLVGYEVC